jgi:glycosyltransferase family protein
MIKNVLLSIYNKLLDLKIIYKNRIASFKFDGLPKPIIKSTDETIDYIIKNRCSVSRFGDGEFAILQGKSILFQSYDLYLHNSYIEILQGKTTNHIVAIPHSLNETKKLKFNAAAYWELYFKNNYYYIYRYFNLQVCYYDSLITRFYMDNRDKTDCIKIIEKLQKIWDNQNILFVEGEHSRLGVGNDLFANSLSVKRILAPAKDAFAQYETIVTAVKQHAAPDDLILIALGPTATALAWDLSKLGYWAIDIGHIDIEYEWMNMGATEKVAVKNKFVGDIVAFDEDQNSDLEAYKKSIIKIIS